LFSGVGSNAVATIDQRYRASVNCADTLTDGVENLCEDSTVVAGSPLDGAGF